MKERADGQPAKLRVLIVEDDPVDVDLLVSTLQQEGYSLAYDVAADPETYLRKWTSHSYDIVFADHKLPSWSGMDALKLHHKLGKDVPFIVVTGSLGDEAAVNYIKHGASDYVLKFRLKRLPLAVAKALKEKTHRDERKALEEQLRQSQKMEAVGRLAGGVAHDFNNLLTIILGRCELLTDFLPAGSASRRHAEEILAASEQAAALTQQLLAFSRKQAIHHEVIDLNAVIRTTQTMLERLIPENIQLVMVLASPLGYVKANRTQIEQILLNLIINARDAMPSGGKLTIETRPVSLPEPSTPEPIDAKPGKYVVITVSDTGVGMSTDTLAHLFEPFYTTKQIGKGTGLGLPTVYGIVRQSGGVITVDSRLNTGTTFRIYLPRTEKAPKILPVAEPRQERGQETIMVVEDNVSVRQHTVEILKLKGYHVLSAANADDAVQIFKEFRGVIHLLLTDVVMPGESGPALAKRLRELRPSLKVLYMSGYTQEMISQQGILDAAVTLLAKPFTIQELSWKIREVLDGKNRRFMTVQNRSRQA